MPWPVLGTASRVGGRERTELPSATACALARRRCASTGAFECVLAALDALVLTRAVGRAGWGELREAVGGVNQSCVVAIEEILLRRLRIRASMPAAAGVRGRLPAGVGRG